MKEGLAKKPGSLPDLTDAQIEQIAQDCAQQVCPQMFIKPQPVDPAEFIEEELGFDLDYLYLSHCQLYLGLTCFKNMVIPVFDMERFQAQKAYIPAGTVIIDRGLYEQAGFEGHEGRLRFTMAHEAGHCLLHSDYFLHAAARTKANEKDYASGTGQSAVTDMDRAEHQADMFASCFLIPRTPLMNLIKSFKAAGWEDRDKLLLVKETFNVSWPTAFYRLKGLGLLDSTSNIYNREEFSEF